MWIFATRNRLANCQRFIQQWHATQASSLVYVRLDECDPALSELKQLPWPKEFLVVVGPRIRLRGAMEEMYHRFPNESWYGLMADDFVPQTMHWDQQLIERAVPNDIAYGNDIHEKANRMCHFCIGGDLVRFVGFFGLPGVDHFGTDYIWERIHHACNRRNKLMDVIIEHAHYNFGQSEFDQTYKESQALKAQDKAAYRAWMANNLDSLLLRIRERFGWS
jgi:hypothetical protein